MNDQIFFTFQKLEVYILSKALVKDVYALTKNFPDFEKFGIVSQLNRAAVSVPSNIVEGYSRNTIKDKTHFLNIAYGSLMELICQIDISLDLNYINENQYHTFLKKHKFYL
jgi:four helix bundle protein